MIVGRHPRIRLAMDCVRKDGGEVPTIRKKEKVLMETALKSLKTLLDMGYDKFSLPFVDIDIHLSQKLYFQYLCFIK